MSGTPHCHSYLSRLSGLYYSSRIWVLLPPTPPPFAVCACSLFEVLLCAPPQSASAGRAEDAGQVVEADARGDGGGGGVWPFLGLPLPVDAPGIRPSSLVIMRVIAEARRLLSCLRLLCCLLLRRCTGGRGGGGAACACIAYRFPPLFCPSPSCGGGKAG